MCVALQKWGCSNVGATPAMEAERVFFFVWHCCVKMEAETCRLLVCWKQQSKAKQWSLLVLCVVLLCVCAVWRCCCLMGLLSEVGRFSFCEQAKLAVATHLGKMGRPADSWSIQIQGWRAFCVESHWGNSSGVSQDWLRNGLQLFKGSPKLFARMLKIILELFSNAVSAPH